MIEPTDDDVGRKVRYISQGKDVVETGVITKVGKYFVFVRYGTDTHTKATSRENLDWETPDEVGAGKKRK